MARLIPHERVRDPFELLVPGYGLNRNPERTLRRWEAGHNAGFTTGRGCRSATGSNSVILRPSVTIPLQ
jgi:hypothetical protein